MAKFPIISLVRDKANIFREAYLGLSHDLFTDPESGRRFHQGEFGRYREELLKNLLRSFLPDSIGMGEGFVVDRNGGISTQTDFIAYDFEATPKIEDSSMRRFFPIETTLAVGEVKSNVKFSELKQYLAKLQAVKEMGLSAPRTLIPLRPPWRVAEILQLQRDLQIEWEGRPPQHVLLAELAKAYNPVEHYWQSKVSFLVCSQLDFGKRDIVDGLKELVSEPRMEAKFAMSHNMLLSVEDGYQGYYDENGNLPYPRSWSDKFGESRATGMTFVPADPENNHIIAFASDLASAIGDTASYPFTACEYLPIARTKYPW